MLPIYERLSFANFGQGQPIISALTNRYLMLRDSERFRLAFLIFRADRAAIDDYQLRGKRCDGRLPTILALYEKSRAFRD